MLEPLTAIDSPDCITEDGAPGSCVKITDCPVALALAHKGVYPKTCDTSIDNLVSVCCRAGMYTYIG